MGEQEKQEEKENGGVDPAWAEQGNPSERFFKLTVYK